MSRSARIRIHHITSLRFSQAHFLTLLNISPSLPSPLVSSSFPLDDKHHRLSINQPIYRLIVSVRNEQASYVALRSLLLNALKVQTAESDKVALGKLLLDDTKKSDRLLMALTLRVRVGIPIYLQFAQPTRVLS